MFCQLAHLRVRTAEMSETICVYLVRHGETRANAERLVCGQLDVPLSAVGIDQALTLRGYIEDASIRPTHWFTSTLSRAVETHNIIFPGARYERVCAFNETDTGTVSEWTVDELHMHEPRFMKQGLNCDLRYPNGESISDVYRRMHDWIESNIFGGRFEPGSSLSIVAHGGTVNCFLHSLLQIPLSLYPAFSVNNATLTELMVDLHDRSPMLLRYNVPYSLGREKSL